MKIEIEIKDTASDLLKSAINNLEGPKRKQNNEVAAYSAALYAREIMQEFNDQGGWKGPRYMRSTAPGVGSGKFGATVAKRWEPAEISADGATIRNDAPYYRFKIDGGTIKPWRAKALTIPLIPGAKGVSAAEYQGYTGRKLFTIRGRNALFERVGGQITGSRGRRGRAGATLIKTSQIIAVYALVKSVTIDPMPEALPDKELLTEEFTSSWMESMLEDLENA